MRLVWAVATVNLPGLRRGEAALIEPEKESIRGRLAAGTLRICTVEEAAYLDGYTEREGGEDA